MNLPLVMASPLKQAEGASVGQSAAMPVAAPTPPATASAAAPIGQVGLATRAAGGRGGGALDQFQSQSVTESVYWPYPESRDRYDGVEPNRFKNTLEHPLSTFGADVDTASFVNVRRFLSNGQLPPTDAVRVEDFLNYFKPDYAQPRGGQPLALTAEIGDCPWAPSHKPVLIGAQLGRVSRDARGRNIVLLLDVSIYAGRSAALDQDRPRLLWIR